MEERLWIASELDLEREEEEEEVRWRWEEEKEGDDESVVGGDLPQFWEGGESIVGFTFQEVKSITIDTISGLLLK